MRLYTRTGDDGTTGLIGAGRVGKHDARVAAYGDVDETNAAIGWALSECPVAEIREALRQIQNDLFVLGTELATPTGERPSLSIVSADIDRLEGYIDRASAAVAPLKNFVLPGGSESAARLHLARTVCRRAERALSAMFAAGQIRREALIYLNRLSDLLFAFARLANARAGVADVPWIPDAS